MRNRLYWLFRILEEVAWVGGFFLVANYTSIWVALGISAMFLGYGLSRLRKDYEAN